MARVVATLAALVATLVTAPACLAAPADAHLGIPAGTGFRIGNVDNLRFGLTTFQDAATATLFAGRSGISAGFDYNLGRGFALGFDTVNLYKDVSGVGYFLSVNPIQLKYRFGLPIGNPAHLMPYGSVGGGIALMGLLGAPGDLPRGGIGYSGSAALGVMLNDGITVEAGYGGGRVGGVTDYGMQMRFGTAFDTLADLPFWPWRQAIGPQSPGGGGGGEVATNSGLVTGVVGDRLALQLPPSLGLKEGSNVLVYIEEGIKTRVAVAQIESLDTQGRATARVLELTEPIKPGYRVRGL